MKTLREVKIGETVKVVKLHGSEHREGKERREEQIGETDTPTANWVISLGDVARLLWRTGR